jgi:small subunit ribosomal protein S9
MPKINTGEKYIEAVGRRKTSVARVRIVPSAKTNVVVNDKALNQYFKTLDLVKTVGEPFGTTKTEQNFDVSVHVNGGGVSSQAEAIRHGVARALVLWNHETRISLKKAGFLKRDPRAKERRKFGLKKARKAPQWSKR